MHRARRCRGKVDADNGAAAVEFGLLLPLILVIVLGIIDFGGMLHAQVTLTQAAREGARVAALQDPDSPTYDPDEVETRTKDAVVSPLLDQDQVGVLAYPECPDEAGDAVVEVTYQFEYITPVGAFAGMFGGEGFDSAIALSATGVMPCET